MKPTRPANMKDYIPQIIILVWLVIIAVQFICSYIFGLKEIDFKAVYIVMLCITIGVYIIRAAQRVKQLLDKKEVTQHDGPTDRK